MIVNYDVKKIDRALSDFHNATGIDMDFLKPDFTPASSRRPTEICYCRAAQGTEAGKLACERSDAALLERCRDSGKNETCICHAGLLNVAIPLFYERTVLGYIIFGRMKPDADHMPDGAYLEKLGLDFEEMQGYYGEIPIIPTEKIESVSNIAIMLAKYILLKNMLIPHFDNALERALAFIRDNLSGDLSIKEISKNANISKSVLYRQFRKHLGCTVIEYVNKKRIERAVALMKDGARTIEDISQNVGCAGAAYFSRMFKKQMGMSPIKYRKTLEE